MQSTTQPPPRHRHLDRCHRQPSPPHLYCRRYLDPQHYKVIQHYNLLADADFVHCMAYDARGKHSTMKFAKVGKEGHNTCGNMCLLGFLPVKSRVGLGTHSALFTPWE